MVLLKAIILFAYLISVNAYFPFLTYPRTTPNTGQKCKWNYFKGKISTPIDVWFKQKNAASTSTDMLITLGMSAITGKFSAPNCNEQEIYYSPIDLKKVLSEIAKPEKEAATERIPTQPPNTLTSDEMVCDDDFSTSPPVRSCEGSYCDMSDSFEDDLPLPPLDFSTMPEESKPLPSLDISTITEDNKPLPHSEEEKKNLEPLSPKREEPQIKPEDSFENLSLPSSQPAFSSESQGSENEFELSLILLDEGPKDFSIPSTKPKPTQPPNILTSDEKVCDDDFSTSPPVRSCEGSYCDISDSFEDDLALPPLDLLTTSVNNVPLPFLDLSTIADDNIPLPQLELFDLTNTFEDQEPLPIFNLSNSFEDTVTVPLPFSEEKITLPPVKSCEGSDCDSMSYDDITEV